MNDKKPSLYSTNFKSRGQMTCWRDWSNTGNMLLAALGDVKASSHLGGGAPLVPEVWKQQAYVAVRSRTKPQSKGKPSSWGTSLEEEGNTWNSQSLKRVIEQEPNFGESPNPTWTSCGKLCCSCSYAGSYLSSKKKFRTDIHKSCHHQKSETLGIAQARMNLLCQDVHACFHGLYDKEQPWTSSVWHQHLTALMTE